MVWVWGRGALFSLWLRAQARPLAQRPCFPHASCSAPPPLPARSEEDVHCGKGHRCVPSAAFPEYKVCRPADLQSLFG